MLGRGGSLTHMLVHTSIGTEQDTNCCVCFHPIEVPESSRTYISSTAHWTSLTTHCVAAVRAPRTAIQRVHVGECEAQMQHRLQVEYNDRFLISRRHRVELTGKFASHNHWRLVQRFADDNDLNAQIESSYLRSPQTAPSYQITVWGATAEEERSDDDAESAREASVSENETAIEIDNENATHPVDVIDRTAQIYQTMLDNIDYDASMIDNTERRCFQSAMLVFDVGVMDLQRYLTIAASCAYKGKEDWPPDVSMVRGWFHVGNPPTASPAMVATGASPTCHVHLVLVMTVRRAHVLQESLPVKWSTWLSTLRSHAARMEECASVITEWVSQQYSAGYSRVKSVYRSFSSCSPADSQPAGYSVNQQSAHGADGEFVYFMDARALYSAHTLRPTDLMVYHCDTTSDSERMPILYDQEQDIQTELQLAGVGLRRLTTGFNPVTVHVYPRLHTNNNTNNVTKK